MSSTVTGTALPSSAKTRVMPILRPTNPRLMSVSFIVARIAPCAGCYWPAVNTRLLQLDLDVDTRRQIEFHPLVDCLVGRIDDVHQPQVRANLELIARSLVHMRRTQNVVALDLRRQRHGTLDDSAGALRRLDDFERRLIDQLVIERLQTNADSLVLHRFTFGKTARKALGSSLPLPREKRRAAPELCALICSFG